MNDHALMNQSIGHRLDLSVLSRAWNWIKSRALGTDESQVPGELIASWSLTSDMRARPLIHSRLASWGLDGLAEAAELLVDQLIVDAGDHARGPYRLTVWATDGVLRCEVESEDAQDAPTPHDLQVFRRLACCWGAAGKAFWFEIPMNAQDKCRNSAWASGDRTA
ncbi:hypothetical protein [Nonomuraea sp. JJY05]|jgi:hypothetical protein|uniref:hypothetical protein n=1 Tax=Nonomuraea sp. JJY05 TaxID=3350255 RepID=UPI00373FA5E3